MNLFYKVGNDLWFMGIYSNNFVDEEGDILTKEAHEEYAQWLKTTGVKPPITILHQPHYSTSLHLVHYMALVQKLLSGEEFTRNLRSLYKPFAIAEAQTVIPVNGFNLVVGKVYDNKRELAERLMERAQEWGMSHGFVVLSGTDNVIDKYRSFEFSILPRELAANRVTTTSYTGKEMGMSELADKGMISEEDRQLLDSLKVLPEDVEEATKMATDILSRFLGSKSVEAEETAVPETVEEVVEEEAVEEVEVVEETVTEEEKSVTVQYDTKALDELVSKMTDAFKAVADRLDAVEAAHRGLLERLDVSDQAMKALKMTEDEKIASAFVVPDWSLTVSKRSVMNKKEADPDEADLLEELKNDIPEENDEKAKLNDPLYLGFRSLFNS